MNAEEELKKAAEEAQEATRLAAQEVRARLPKQVADGLPMRSSQGSQMRESGDYTDSNHQPENRVLALIQRNETMTMRSSTKMINAASQGKINTPRMIMEN